MKREIILKTGFKGAKDFDKAIKIAMLEQEHNVSETDLDLFKITDSPKEAMQYIEDFYKTHELKPNF